MQITDDMTKEERQVYWEMVIEEWSSSGLTKTEYCQKNDIPVSTFNYWYNKISNLDAENNGDSRFTELILPDGDKGRITVMSDFKGDFVPELSVSYNGARIYINSETPMQLFQSVLGVFGYA